MSDSYYSKVSVIGGNKVRYSYHIKQYIHESYQLQRMIDIIFEKTGVNFTWDASRREQLPPEEIPTFNLSRFNRTLKYSLNWPIEDSKVRDQFVTALKMLEPLLAGMNLIDQMDINTKSIWSEIVRNQNKTPLLITGEKVYKLTMVEDVSGRPVRPQEAFREAIAEEIQSIRLQYEQCLEQEIKAFQADMECYPLTMEDFYNNFISFIKTDSRGNKTKCLAKKIIYCPIRIMFDRSGKEILKIKEEYREGMKREMFIVYEASGAQIKTIKMDLSLNEDSCYKELAYTPHTFSDGTLCCGSFYIEKNLPYLKAKETLNHIEEMLKLINLSSLANGRIMFKGQLRNLYDIGNLRDEVCISQQTTLIEDGMIL